MFTTQKDCSSGKTETLTEPKPLKLISPKYLHYFPGIMVVIFSFLPVKNIVDTFFPEKAKVETTTTEANAPLLETEAFWKQGTFTDPRDGRVYRTIQFDNMIWMAENLQYETSDSWCYDHDPHNCKNFGRLYSYESAKRACPDGWHLPNERAEWSKLRTLLSGHKPAYRTLIAGGISRFDALLGGKYVPGEGFNGKNDEGAYWSNSYFGKTGSSAWSYRFVRKSAILDHEVQELNAALSCRCVQNYPEYSVDSRYND